MNLGPGRIVWAVYPSDRGDGKLRPMVVVNATKEIVRTGRVAVVVCSTEFARPLTTVEVELPSHPEGRCVSKLTRETVAVCDWSASLPCSDLDSESGVVPTAILREICQKAGFSIVSER